MAFTDWLRLSGRPLALTLLAALALAAGGTPTSAVPHYSYYQGADPSKAPATLQRFVTTHGLKIKYVEVNSGYLRYDLESEPFSTPWAEWNGGKGTDTVRVEVTMHDTAAEADAEFARQRATVDSTCTYFSSFPSGAARCVTVPLGAGAYGMAYIFGENRRPVGPPHVAEKFVIRAPGPGDITITVDGGAFSSWTSPDVPAKAVAAELVKLTGGAEAPREAAAPAAPAQTAGPASKAAQVQALSDARWSALPLLPEAERTVTGRNDFLVFRGNDGRFDCLPKVPNLPGPTRAPGGDFRLLEARELMLTVLRGMGLSEADIAAILEGSNASGAKIPAAVRERAYMLWRPGRVSHYLYGAQLVLSPEQGGGVQPAEFELPQEPCPLASSEHSSVRGTINGGGDFIGFRPVPGGVGRPMLIRAAFDRPPLAGPGTVVETPGAVVTLGADAVAAIDLAPNGVAAVALLAGSGSLAEIESGAQRRLAPGTVAVSVPGLGVSPPIALPDDDREALEAIAAAPAAGPAHPTPEVHRDPAAGYEFSIPPGWEEGGGTQGFNLVNPADHAAFQVVVQNNDEPIPADQLYAGVAEVFRTDPDYELVRAGPRRLTSIGRDGYAFLLRSRADGRALAVISAPRDIGPRSRDFYILKIRWPGPDGQAAVEALERLLTGFRIID